MHRRRNGLTSGEPKSHAYDDAQLMVIIAIVSMHAMLYTDIYYILIIEIIILSTSVLFLYFIVYHTFFT